jgi:hypothetical protein
MDLELWLTAELTTRTQTAGNGEEQQQQEQKERVATARLFVKFVHPPPSAPPIFEQPRVQLRLPAPLPAHKTFMRMTAKYTIPGWKYSMAYLGALEEGKI